MPISPTTPYPTAPPPTAENVGRITGKTGIGLALWLIGTVLPVIPVVGPFAGVVSPILVKLGLALGAAGMIDKIRRLALLIQG